MPRVPTRGDASRPGWCCGRSATTVGRSPACRTTTATGTVPNDRGRVRPGLYVAGWIKRGPTGFIGTNKSCAQETVERILDDLDAGTRRRRARSARRRRSPTGRGRGAGVVDLAGWRAIDAEERRRGAAPGRPRAKIVDVAEMVRVAADRASTGRRAVTLRRSAGGRREAEMSRSGMAQDGRQARWDQHNRRAAGDPRRRRRGDRGRRARRRVPRPADRRARGGGPHRRLPPLRRPRRPRPGHPGARSWTTSASSSSPAVIARGHHPRDRPPHRRAPTWAGRWPTRRCTAFAGQEADRARSSTASTGSPRMFTEMLELAIELLGAELRRGRAGPGRPARLRAGRAVFGAVRRWVAREPREPAAASLAELLIDVGVEPARRPRPPPRARDRPRPAARGAVRRRRVAGERTT